MNYYFSNRNEYREHQRQASKSCNEEKTKYSAETYRKEPMFVPMSAKYSGEIIICTMSLM